MSRRRSGAAWCCVLVVVVACRGKLNAAEVEQEGARREAAYQARIRQPDSTWAPVARWILPRFLSEVSGLALMPDQRIIAHDDEFGRLSIIDPRRGVVDATFQLEGGNTRDDFEGITRVGDAFYMITSHGRIYIFGEGQDRTTVPFRIVDTRLGEECEFEGIVYDPSTTDLILPCKRVAEKKLRDQLVLYRVATPLGESPVSERVIIPIERVADAGSWKTIHPTDIARDPTSGNYVIIAAPERAVIEITPSGDVVRAASLPGQHEQPEGIAMTNNGVLIVSDEAVSRPAAITLYRWPPRETLVPDSTARDSLSAPRGAVP